MGYRPFRWYGQSEIEFLRQSFEEKAKQWARHWGFEEPDGTSGPPALSFAQAEQIQARRVLLEPLLGLSDGLSDVRAFGQLGCYALLGDEAASQLMSVISGRRLGAETLSHPLTSHVLEKCIGDFTGRIGAGSSLHQRPSELEVFAQASGWLFAEFRWPQVVLCILLAPDIVQKLLPLHKKPALDRRHSAKDSFKGLSAKVYAELAPVTLSIGELSSLAVGDVVRLPHSLDDAAFVKSGAGATLCRAVLGKKDENRALQIASAR